MKNAERDRRIKMLEVGVFSTGYIGADLNKICKLLNAPRHTFKFTKAENFTALGEHDLYDYGYSDYRFNELIETYMDEYDVCVVLTIHPIEDNYFSRVTKRNIIVCTSHESFEFVKASGRSIEEYFAASTVPELLCNEYEKRTGGSPEDPFHPEVHGCAFDNSARKEQVVHYLEKLALSDTARGFFSSNNVSGRYIEYFDSMLNHIRKPSFKKALLSCFLSPILSFVYGGIIFGFLISFLSSILLSGEQFSELNAIHKWVTLCLICSVFAFPIVIYMNQWYSYFIKNRRAVAAA